MADEKIYHVASVIAKRKADAIEKALANCFGGEAITEKALNALLNVEIEHDGTETYFANGGPILKVSPITSDTQVNGLRVTCLFHQEIEVLY